MKTVSGALASHFGQGCMTIAILWKVTRKDGTILGFTTHDQDITYNDGTNTVTYQGATGMSPSATETSVGFAVDNLQISAFLDAGSITESDLTGGKYSFADIEVRVVNWADLTMGDMKLRKGTLGQTYVKGGIFTSEIRGLSYHFGTIIGQTFGPVCRYDLGDANCTVNLTPLSQNGTVASFTDARAFVPSGLTGAAGYFVEGVLTWLTGANAGLTMDVGEWNGTTITLFESMANAIAIGDTFKVEPGCNHFTSDCFGKFNNIVNFGGEPDIPGTDKIMQYPDAR
jgi:uncharacterized phage protein (TIGR02218 family)